MASKVTASSGNIFLDLGFPPHEAEVMLLRAQLAEALRKVNHHRGFAGSTDQQVAHHQHRHRQAG